MPSEVSDSVWGSDAIADMLRSLDIPYVLLNPGASFRGLHDSIVNHLGNQTPQMMVVLHEEHAVAIAHGYAKVTEKPLAAILHSNVGLMHGSMAIFNAYADRVPVIVLGATGPVDAAKRRPWIDWLHTAQDQAALVRHFIKWDAQPASVPAAQEAMLRAHQIATTAPKGPVYVCLDAEVQEAKLGQAVPIPKTERYKAPPAVFPGRDQTLEAAQWLYEAKRPVILMGRVSRSTAHWAARVALAEKLNAHVITDLKLGAAFPTTHPLHPADSGMFLTPDAISLLKQADVVLSLDWLDLAGTLKQAWGSGLIASRIVQVSVDHHVHNGWSMDHQALPPADLFLACEPHAAVEAISSALMDRPKKMSAVAPSMPTALTASKPEQHAINDQNSEPLTVPMAASTLRRLTYGKEVCLLRLPLSWSGDLWDFEGPLDFLGYDGGGGIGSGPGMAVGGALALKGTSRLPVAIIGDGDFLMGVSAFWTAANARLPLLTVVMNNRSFFNDELHQERVARQRERPVENRWIGQRIADPEPDLAMMARAQGLVGIGPVRNMHELEAALTEAIAAAANGASVVVDVHVTPGYSAVMATEMTRSHTK